MSDQRKLTWFACLAAVGLLISSCGDSSSDADSAGEVSATSVAESEAPEDSDGESAQSDLQDSVDELADDLEDMQDSQGGGSATLTVGDMTWTFESVLCAFGEDQIGQEGAVFNLSSIQDGMQMYASIDEWGHSVSLDDIEDFENPSVSLSASNGEFIVLDGKSITAESDFMDGTSDSFDTVPGTFTATCP